MSTRPLRILVVDDDPAMVGAITALVGTEGHQVITAYDGLTAVKRFREEHPDLVLLDLAMPLWLASLVTTVLYAAAAGLLALRGRDELKETGVPIPERTKQSVKEDIQWAKTRAQSKDR